MLLRGTVCCSAVHHVHMGTEPHHVPNARSGRSFQAMAVPRFWHVYKNMHFIIFFFGLHKREVFHESAVSDYHFPFLTCRCVLPPVFSFTRQPRWAGKPGDVLWWSRDRSLAERRELETFSSWPLQQIQASSVGHSMHLFCISISVR